MITVFHGDNFVASRQILNQTLKPKAKRLTAKSLNAETLTQTLESGSLFGDEQQLVIDGLFSLPQSGLKDQLIEIINRNHDQDVFLWEKKPVNKTNQKKLPQANFKEFKTSKLIFKLLDSLKPNNSKTLLTLNNQIKEPTEFTFYLLCRRLAQLIQAKDSPETLKGAPWQIGKLKHQAQTFSLNQLLQLHHQLLEIDYQIKTGQTDVPLAAQLDLWLANL